MQIHIQVAVANYSVSTSANHYSFCPQINHEKYHLRDVVR